MDIVDRIVKKREQILKVCSRFGATNVRVFGSCARDDYDKNSDVDILVHINNKNDAFEYIERLDSLKSQLEQLLGASVDVADEDALRGRFQEIILNEAVAL
jgi:predicted nucleotidyltransferase